MKPHDVDVHVEPPLFTIRTYWIGFLLSLVLTMAAYHSVADQLITGHVLVATIVSLALLQAIVQLLCFLHLGEEVRPRWNLLVFWLMLSILLIIVIGSLWIMTNLNYRVMPAMDMTTMLRHESM